MGERRVLFIMKIHGWIGNEIYTEKRFSITHEFRNIHDSSQHTTVVDGRELS